MADPINTGKKTKAGRIVWQDPKTKKQYSEITVTIPTKVDRDGKPAKDTKWALVPSVFDGGKIINDEDFLVRFYKQNKYVDPLTKKKLKIFDSAEEAGKYAQERSDSLLED